MHVRKSIGEKNAADRFADVGHKAKSFTRHGANKLCILSMIINSVHIGSVDSVDLSVYVPSGFQTFVLSQDVVDEWDRLIEAFNG